MVQLEASSRLFLFVYLQVCVIFHLKLKNSHHRVFISSFHSTILKLKRLKHKKGTMQWYFQCICLIDFLYDAEFVSVI